MSFTRLESRIREHVITIFQSPGQVSLPYHNLEHTQSVVYHALEIAHQYALNDHELFIVQSAAWFHDIGHLYGPIDGHEQRSAVIARRFLNESGADDRVVHAIGKCILATTYGYHPLSFLEKVICDADTYHLGTAVFRRTDPLVRQETEMRTEIREDDWHQKSARFLKAHVFYTIYCQLLLNKGKLENIAWLEAGAPD